MMLVAMVSIFIGCAYSLEGTWPQTVMTCSSGDLVMTSDSLTSDDYDAVYESVAQLYNSLPQQCNATYCPQADWSGCVLRVAGHDFMDFNGSVGGSDGCIDLDDKDNSGLQDCLYRGQFAISMLQAYQEHCSKVSLADFVVIAAESVVQLARRHVLIANSSRMTIDFKSGFLYGRTTSAACPWATGRMPNPEESCGAVEKTFVQSMGLSWEQSAALMGVHTLGRAKAVNNGYDGSWSNAESSRRFNNDYYASILNKGWTPEVVNGNPLKNQWRRSDGGANVATLGKEIMLNTDLCLAFTNDLNGLSFLDAAGKTCCAWRFASNDKVRKSNFSNYYNPGEGHCGTANVTTDIREGFQSQKTQCCGTIRLRDCGNAFNLRGPAYETVKSYSRNEEEWLRSFVVAWRIATSNGFHNLKPLLPAARLSIVV